MYKSRKFLKVTCVVIGIVGIVQAIVSGVLMGFRFLDLSYTGSKASSVIGLSAGLSLLVFSVVSCCSTCKHTGCISMAGAILLITLALLSATICLEVTIKEGNGLNNNTEVKLNSVVKAGITPMLFAARGALQLLPSKARKSMEKISPDVKTLLDIIKSSGEKEVDEVTSEISNIVMKIGDDTMDKVEEILPDATKILTLLRIDYKGRKMLRNSLLGITAFTIFINLLALIGVVMTLCEKGEKENTKQKPLEVGFRKEVSLGPVLPEISENEARVYMNEKGFVCNHTIHRY